MGMRYVLYRIRHEVEKRTGILKKKHPSNLKFLQPISLKEWRREKNSYVIGSKESFSIPKFPSVALKTTAERILSGDFLFFNSTWISLGQRYDWITNPSNQYSYDITKHWSEIKDFSDQAGDIKFVWERSRFSYLLTLIRYDYHFNEDLSEFIFSQIESWIDSNPINKGPNWLCSQEISLRILNWCYALYYYQNSKSLTEQLWQKIQQVIYASIHHIYHHISFSRIAVRNNHAITETLFLTLSNLLFPFIPETKQWSKKGERWFEKEINYQIYDDGTFLQFSMNYNRVVVQLLSLGISIYSLNNKCFSSNIYKKAYRTLNFLCQSMQNENGQLPNYGSNDGALFFPLSDTDYRDYRPQLNTLHYILTGKNLFIESIIKEDSFWLGNVTIEDSFLPILQKQGIQQFINGGYYLCRNNDYFTFIRCGNHKDRPAQADNLHLDIWYKGENILRDSGTHQYNTDATLLDYFMGSKSHNVVMVENYSQMLKGGRFIWYYWTQKLNANWKETADEFIFSGKIKAFGFLNKKASHQRIIHVSKISPQWIVKDELINLDDYLMKQLWHPNHKGINFSSKSGKKLYFTSYNSNYYGEYTVEQSFYYEFNKKIETKIVFNE